MRGYHDCAYHADILAKFERTELLSDFDLSEQWTASCPGGGRVDVNAPEKSVVIYGYSQGFGRADHALTSQLVKEAMPDYEVTWNNEGY
mgnify:CR=1 FL=1